MKFNFVLFSTKKGISEIKNVASKFIPVHPSIDQGEAGGRIEMNNNKSISIIISIK